MNTIFWMTDELFAKSKPSDWRTVSELSGQLISLIGKPQFTHTIINPTDCIGRLAENISAKSFSAVIDLTDNGWLSAGLGLAIARKTPIITDIHISRVREISNPSLPTSGHLIRTSDGDIRSFIQEHDLSRPLILDDVSFSGRSSKLVMNLLNLNTDRTTHGFLITNIGNLGTKTPGALSLLEQSGSMVATGAVINTSQGDDGWHIKDFVRHPQLDRALGLIPLIHEALQLGESHRDFITMLFSLESTRSLLFPNAVRGEQLNELSETQFIRAGNISKEGMHTTNPNLLMSPAFLEHISVKQFWNHLDTVSDLLHEIQALTELPEGNRETSQEMNRIVEDQLASHSIERRIQ